MRAFKSRRAKGASRRYGRAIGTAAILIGLVLMGWPVYQYVYSHFHQQALLSEFAATPTDYPVALAPQFPQVDVPDPGDRDEVQTDEFVDPGPFLIIIDKIGLKARVLEGITDEVLARGPGFYPQSAVPGEPGNVSIAGHRNSHGRWFLNVHLLTEGDIIVLQSPLADYEYAVESVFIVEPSAWEVVDPTDDPKLTLTTCHNGVTKRMIVRAGLVRINAEGF